MDLTPLHLTPPGLHHTILSVIVVVAARAFGNATPHESNKR
jgi:hypothetical protein